MHSCNPQNGGAIASVAIESALRAGRDPVVVWLPSTRRDRPACFDVYVCERLPDGSYKAHALVDTVCCDEHGFSRDGATWHAHLAGAGFRRFHRRVPHGLPMRGQSCVFLPSGEVVGAI